MRSVLGDSIAIPLSITAWKSAFEEARQGCEDVGQEGLEISRIGISNKQHILDQLDRINVNATTVYPSVDRTAVKLRERYLSQPTD